jgi:DNA-binding MarR family transcriptional regulator
VTSEREAISAGIATGGEVPTRIVVADEVRYDLVQENFDLLLHLVDESLTALELAMRTGADPHAVEHCLKRLERRGLVVPSQDAGRWRAAGRHVFQERQEGVMDAMHRYILPAVTKSLTAEDPEEASFAETRIELLPSQVGALNKAGVQSFVNELLTLSDQDDPGPRRHCQVVVAGCPLTPELAAADLPEGTRVMGLIKQAAVHRARTETRNQAILLQVDMLLAAGTRAAIREAIHRFDQSLVTQFGAAAVHPFGVTVFFVAGEPDAPATPAQSS